MLLVNKSDIRLREHDPLSCICGAEPGCSEAASLSEHLKILHEGCASRKLAEPMCFAVGTLAGLLVLAGPQVAFCGY